MNRTTTTSDTGFELFENLQTLCDERPRLPGDHGESASDGPSDEGHGQYDRLMAHGLDMEVEWGNERLA
jgi:hypothetical protein